MKEASKNILVGGSWKMYKTVKESIAYAKGLNDFCLENISEKDKIEVFFLPTYLPLYSLKEIVNSPKLKYGAQNCAWEDEGSFTGEVSPAHLKDSGCSYIMLGHAERRKLFGEDDRMINKKVLAALRNGLAPILCIGERENTNNIKDTFKFLSGQLLTGLDGVDAFNVGRVILAYEPVWAIGANTSAPVRLILEIISFIR
ncbi:MAG: triose-phosphate isomerase, partial [Desulfobacterales bacterium]|nr:triose-phosphate isomerase [Desulfobacterales bacterium]